MIGPRNPKANYIQERSFFFFKIRYYNYMLAKITEQNCWTVEWLLAKQAFFTSVQTSLPLAGECEVVAFGTGNFNTKASASTSGRIVHDSHAVVTARRSLMRLVAKRDPLIQLTMQWKVEVFFFISNYTYSRSFSLHTIHIACIGKHCISWTHEGPQTSRLTQRSL